MITRLLLAGLHLLALGIGLGAVWSRARALKGRLDLERMRRVLTADAWWGVAGGLWLLTGLARLFMPVEKGSAYYLGNHVFLTKIALFVAIVALEVWSSRTFGPWRAAVRRGELPADAGATAAAAERLARISYVETALVVGMVFLAVTMARGIG